MIISGDTDKLHTLRRGDMFEAFDIGSENYLKDHISPARQLHRTGGAGGFHAPSLGILGHVNVSLPTDIHAQHREVRVGQYQVGVQNKA